MQFAFVFLALAASAFAQSVRIAAPSEFATVPAGSNLLVDIQKPGSISPSADVSVAIGLHSCGQTDCNAPVNTGTFSPILFKGDYTPQPLPASTTEFQNYTVKVPNTMAPGPALLSVAHFFLIGAGSEPTVETIRQVINIV